MATTATRTNKAVICKLNQKVVGAAQVGPTDRIEEMAPLSSAVEDSLRALPPALQGSEAAAKVKELLATAVGMLKALGDQAAAAAAASQRPAAAPAAPEQQLPQTMVVDTPSVVSEPASSTPDASLQAALEAIPPGEPIPPELRALLAAEAALSDELAAIEPGLPVPEDLRNRLAARGRFRHHPYSSQ